MNVIPVIFQTEFMRRIRSRPFILGTLIGAVALVLIALLPALLDRSFGDAGKRIVLAGDATLVAQAKTLLAKDYQIVATTSEVPAHPTLAYLDAHAKASALVVLHGDGSGLRLHVFARDAGAVRSALGDDLVPLNVALATHVPQQRIARLLTVPVETSSFDAKFAHGDSAATAKGVALAMLALLYVSIIFTSQNVLSSVAEEKTSRIAELLVATVAPSRLLAGKILAAAATGALQIGVWAGAAYLAGPLIAAQSGAPAPAPGSGNALFGLGDVLTAPVVIAFAAFFLVGFFQYALLYAAAASLISRTEDLGSVTGPLVIPVVAGFLVAQFAIVAPNEAKVVVLSMLPLISPFVMFTRVAVATVPAWQMALSIAINLGAVVAIAVAAGKIYRVGLLTYGRPPKLAQVWATLRS